ncbi:MAG: SusC/RagA family TonB-linked outer membrane protein [Bacteroidales bacterium]|nr:SusC/RagA family TonB-linked outer membrane protein [Bacteroidales bacterium]
MKNKFIYILLIGCLTFCQSVFAQSGAGDMIRGKVVSETGEELILAQVVEIDRTDRVVGHTLTDMNGEFSLKLFSAQNRLRVTYLGFKQETVNIGSQRNITFVLKEDNVLPEVEIVQKRTVSDGTFQIPEREVPFAMQKMSTKELEGMQITSIDDALQGHIAGLDIVGSGDLGRGASMRIRGTSSINANVEPLIVMNGIPREDINLSESGIDLATANEDQFADLLSVNPDDILEVTVLKDAASTAVWGSRGANGVLMITTKKGVSGPTRINYTYKFSGKKQPKGLKMLSGDDYTMMMKQALFNAYLNNNSSSTRNYLSLRELNYDPEFSEFGYYNNNTDWRDNVIQTGYTHDHYLVISGGGEKANFRVAGGYMTERGTILGQGLDRFTTRMDLDYYVSNRIRFTSEFMFTYTDNDRNWTDTGDHNGYSILDIAYKKMPNLAIYNKDRRTGQDLDTYYNMLESADLGSQKNYKNPVALANLATQNLKSYNVQPVLRLRYDLLDPEKSTLQYNVWVSFQMRNEKTRKYLPKEVSAQPWDNEFINRSTNLDNENFGIQSENSLTWQPKMENEDHSFMAFASLQTTSGSSNSQNVVSYGFPSSSITDPTADGYLKEIKSGIGQSRSLGMIGRMHYAYKSKYILDLTYRCDGSTKFGKSNKYGNFPGVSVRWNISDEPFMDFAKDYLDILSIRPSWGITGNSPTSDYLHFSRYKASGSYNDYPVIYPENIRLSNLKWEKTIGYNLGFDLALLDYTYVLDVNLYHQRTQDMLHKDTKIPTSTGYDNLPYRNGGTMDNDGWEVNFQANRFVKVGNVTFDFKFNLANSVNTIISLDQDILDSYNKDFTYGNKAAYLQRLQEDKSFGSIYGFRYKGVYQYSAKNYQLGTAPIARDANNQPLLDANGQPLPMYFDFYDLGNNGRYEFQAGDAIYEDINHDGTIDELDIVYLGNSNPTLNGGIGITARWKQLSATLFANFRYGNKIINKARMDAESMYNFDNQSIAVNWRWRKEGEDRPIPRALYNYGYNSLPSDRYVEDGSFFRLKYIQVNYAVPSASLKKYGMRQLSFYLTVNNLFCFTKYQGVDPEVSYNGLGISEDTAITPRTKDFTLGITVGF